MDNKTNEIFDRAKAYVKNPLGIIALFLSIIYATNCIVLSSKIEYFKEPYERIPLILFIVVFPFVMLWVFFKLVINHHHKLYAPGEYKDENNFIRPELRTWVNKDNQTVIEETIATSLQLDNISTKVIKSIEIPFNKAWRLNHWGSKCASIMNNKIIFHGKSAPKGSDGCHIDLNYVLDLGKTYRVSCLAKSINGASGKFQLWCHDETISMPIGENVGTHYLLPSENGTEFSINFTAKYNRNIRIHLQYEPGDGSIEVENVKLEEIEI